MTGGGIIWHCKEITKDYKRGDHHTSLRKVCQERDLQKGTDSLTNRSGGGDDMFHPSAARRDVRSNHSRARKETFFPAIRSMNGGLKRGPPSHHGKNKKKRV